MVKAFIFIEMAAGHSSRLVSALKGRPGVKQVDRVTGPYDVIAVLEADDINGISSIVSSEIHTLEGVLRTITCASLGS